MKPGRDSARLKFLSVNIFNAFSSLLPFKDKPILDLFDIPISSRSSTDILKKGVRGSCSRNECYSAISVMSGIFLPSANFCEDLIPVLLRSLLIIKSIALSVRNLAGAFILIDLYC